jgi:hypothetical protein
MQKLFRVENPVSKQGLWYREDGTFNPFITKFPNALARDYPMGFDPAFKVEGLDWISACDNIPDMKNWFSAQDLADFNRVGYHLFEFNVSRYRTVSGHAVFAKEHVLEVNKIDLFLLLK